MSAPNISAIMVANGIPLTVIPTITSGSPYLSAMSAIAAETYFILMELPPKLFQFIAKSIGAFSDLSWVLLSFPCKISHLAVSFETFNSSAISPVVKPLFLSS